jgi:hypothetical protein
MGAFRRAGSGTGKYLPQRRNFLALKMAGREGGGGLGVRDAGSIYLRMLSGRFPLARSSSSVIGFLLAGFLASAPASNAQPSSGPTQAQPAPAAPATAAAASSTPAAPAGPHLITLDDLTRFHDVGGPVVSPDGQWVAYTVSTIEPTADKRITDLWMVSWDGKEDLRLTWAGDVDEESDDLTSSGAPRWSSQRGERGRLRARRCGCSTGAAAKRIS